MTKKKHLSNHNNGMTMVEVLMGFVILVLILGMLSGIIVACKNIYYSSVDLRNAEESLQKAVYSNSILESLSPETTTIRLVPASDMPGNRTPISLSADMYRLSSKTVLDGVEADSLDVDIYFLKTGTVMGE